jgi:hypothetical protein
LSPPPILNPLPFACGPGSVPSFRYPFNPKTTISFEVRNAGSVVLKIYDITGREVYTLLNDRVSAGTHFIEWEPANPASGIYFYRLTGEGFSGVKKMVFQK